MQPSCQNDGRVRCGRKACGQCRLTVYCAETCHRAAWKTHRRVCRAVAGQVARPICSLVLEQLVRKIPLRLCLVNMVERCYVAGRAVADESGSQRRKYADVISNGSQEPLERLARGTNVKFLAKAQAGNSKETNEAVLDSMEKAWKMTHLRRCRWVSGPIRARVLSFRVESAWTVRRVGSVWSGFSWFFVSLGAVWPLRGKKGDEKEREG